MYENIYKHAWKTGDKEPSLNEKNNIWVFKDDKLYNQSLKWL